MKRKLSLYASAALFTAAAPLAGAGTVIYSGAANDLNWNTAGNWSTGLLPTVNDVAQVRDSGYNNGDTLSLTADTTVGRLALNWVTNGTLLDLTIGGTNTLTLSPASKESNQGLNRTSNVAGIQTINANLLLASSQQWNVDGAGSASGASPVDNRVVVNGVVSDSGLGFGFYKTGDHILELNGANTFSGTVALVANQLILGNNNALGTGTLPAFVGPLSGTATTTPSLLTKSGVTLSRAIEVKSGGGVVRLGGANGSTGSVWAGNVALNRDVNLTGAFGSTTGTTEFSGILSDGVDPNNAFVSSNVTKLDKGTVKLSGLDTYSGSTTVSAGTLLIDGSLSSAPSLVTVNASARLGGTGTVSRSVNVLTGGILTPGENGTGTFTVNGGQTLTLGDGAVVEWQAGVDAAHSPLVQTSTLSFGGTPTLKLLPGTTTPNSATSYVLASWDGADPSTLPTWNIDPTTGLSGTVSYLNAADGLPGGEAILSNVVTTATPEPAALGLGATAIALGLRRRRRVGQTFLSARRARETESLSH